MVQLLLVGAFVQSHASIRLLLGGRYVFHADVIRLSRRDLFVEISAR